MNENGLLHPLTWNMKNKDLPLFIITSSTINKKYKKKGILIKLWDSDWIQGIIDFSFRW